MYSQNAAGFPQSIDFDFLKKESLVPLAPYYRTGGLGGNACLDHEYFIVKLGHPPQNLTRTLSLCSYLSTCNTFIQPQLCPPILVWDVGKDRKQCLRNQPLVGAPGWAKAAKPGPVSFWNFLGCGSCDWAILFSHCSWAFVIHSTSSAGLFSQAGGGNLPQWSVPKLPP